jgi:hypothetical protein
MKGLLPRALAIAAVLTGSMTIAAAQPDPGAEPGLQPEQRDPVPPAPDAQRQPAQQDQLDRDPLGREPAEPGQLDRQRDRFEPEPQLRDRRQPGIEDDLRARDRRQPGIEDDFGARDEFAPQQRPGAIGITLGGTGIGDVIVSQVHRGSPADRTGLQPGDHILAVDGRRYASPDAVARAIRRQPGRPVDLVVIRPGMQQPTTLRIPTDDWGQAFAGQPIAGGIQQMGVGPMGQMMPMDRGMPQRMTMRPGMMEDGQQIQQLQSDIDALHQELQGLRRQLSQLRDEVQTLRDPQRPTDRDRLDEPPPTRPERPEAPERPETPAPADEVEQPRTRT